MRAREFINEKKKRRKNKYGLAAWGPGPYGGYGYLAGYSGDSGASSGGDGGGGGGVGEASYSGNLGVMELIQFFREYPDLIKDYKTLKQEKGAETALKWALSKMRLELEPVIQDSAINELKTKITSDDIKRIIKDKLAIDAETAEDAMRKAIDKMSDLPSTLYVKTQAAQLMMLYKAAKMSIGGDYYRKLNKLSENKDFEDYHPNDTPRGPETKPTMPKGTVKVDVSDVYDWYKLGQHISRLKGLGKHDFGKGPPSAVLSFGDEELEHEYIQDLLKIGLKTTDIDPKSHEKIKGQKTDPTYNVENFADGRNPQDKGDSARHGIPKNATIAQLKKIRSSDTASPRKKQLAHWQINMRQGRKKK